MDGIVRTDDVLGGEPRLAGRRISLRQISELAVDGGVPPAEIADQLEISHADVHRALTYYQNDPMELPIPAERSHGVAGSAHRHADLRATTPSGPPNPAATAPTEGAE